MEAKKAFNFELEALWPWRWRKGEEDGEENEGGEWRERVQKFEGKKRRYASFLVKLNWLVTSFVDQILLMGLKHKLNSPRFEFEWFIFSH